MSLVRNLLRESVQETEEETETKQSTEDLLKEAVDNVEANFKVEKSNKGDDDNVQVKNALLSAAKDVLKEDHDSYSSDEYHSDDASEKEQSKQKKPQNDKSNKNLDNDDGDRVKLKMSDIDKEEKTNIQQSENDNDENTDVDDEDDEADDPRPSLDTMNAKMLLKFAFHGNTKKAREMLDTKQKEDGVKEYSVNGKDRHGWTPLMWAASRGHEKFCKFLIERGALLNMKENTNGWTALHISAVNENIEMCRFLMANGAKLKIQDFWGDTPHECAPRPLKSRGEAGKELRALLRC